MYMPFLLKNKQKQNLCVGYVCVYVIHFLLALKSQVSMTRNQNIKNGNFLNISCSSICTHYFEYAILIIAAVITIVLNSYYRNVCDEPYSEHFLSVLFSILSFRLWRIPYLQPQPYSKTAENISGISISGIQFYKIAKRCSWWFCF